MEKDRTLRYPRAADMLEDLKHLPRGGREASTIVSPASVQSHPARTLAMVGTAVVLLSIAALLWQGRGSKSGERGASAVSSSAAPPSIAVLPFADLSASHDQEYFSDGLAEELLNDLANIPACG